MSSGIIYKDFTRVDHEDKYKDSLEVVLESGKPFRVFRWRKKRNDIGMAYSFWSMRDEIMAANGISDSDGDKSKDWIHMRGILDAKGMGAEARSRSRRGPFL